MKKAPQPRGQVRHKPGCTTTKDGLRLEISDFESRGIVYERLIWEFHIAFGQLKPP